MLETYKPDIGELGFRQGLMADPETMSYNAAWGGTIPFPQEDWQDWYEYWFDAPGSGAEGLCRRDRVPLRRRTEDPCLRCHRPREVQEPRIRLRRPAAAVRGGKGKRGFRPVRRYRGGQSVLEAVREERL